MKVYLLKVSDDEMEQARRVLTFKKKFFHFTYRYTKGDVTYCMDTT